ncbi:MAG: hypothetical protein J2P15_11410 [Micromonosporaceae bacterium]|nr:hypothetical protein [Micromonosporaceae bacterium]
MGLRRYWLARGERTGGRFEVADGNLDRRTCQIPQLGIAVDLVLVQQLILGVLDQPLVAHSGQRLGHLGWHAGQPRIGLVSFPILWPDQDIVAKLAVIPAGQLRNETGQPADPTLAVDVR